MPACKRSGSRREAHDDARHHEDDKEELGPLCELNVVHPRVPQDVVDGDGAEHGGLEDARPRATRHDGRQVEGAKRDGG